MPGGPFVCSPPYILRLSHLRRREGPWPEGVFDVRVLNVPVGSPERGGKASRRKRAVFLLVGLFVVCVLIGYLVVPSVVARELVAATRPRQA